LLANTTGAQNTAVGSQALLTCSTGYNNNAVGMNSLKVTTTGHSNNGVGYATLVNNTTGAANVAIGDSALINNTTGSSNTAMGNSANSVTTTGENNTMIGTLCRASSSSVSNEVVLGSNGMVGKGGSTAFISGGNGPVYAGNNSSNFSTTSDRRIKKNIEDNNTGLDAISQVRVCSFEYRTADEIDELPASAAIDKQGVQLGVIAQEIQEILPDMIREESTGCLSVDPENMTWYLVNAVKELSAKNDALEARIATLESG